MTEAWLFFFLLAAAFAIFAQNGRDDVEEAIFEAEEEHDRRRRLDILRKANGNLGYDSPKLLLKLAYATMAVAYEETHWEERLNLAQQAKRAATRAKNVYDRRRWITPGIRQMLNELDAVYGAAEKEEREAEARCRLTSK